MILSNISIKRPVFISMVMMALTIFGFISFKEMGVDLFPRIEFPVITIVSSLPGADPETVERTVSEIIEEAVSSISSIKKLSSISTEGISQVVVEFELNKNNDIAYQEIQAKIGSVRGQLPEDLKEIVVEKFDIDSAPIMTLVVSGSLPIQTLSEITDKQIKDHLQQIPGVGQIKILGKQSRTIWIYLDPYKLEGLNLTVQEVVQALNTQHLDFPGGRLENGQQEFVIKTKAEVDETKKLGDIILAYRNNTPIKIEDVGRIVDGVEEQRSLAKLNEKRALALTIRRQSGTNTVSVAEDVKHTLAKLQTEFSPKGITLEVAQDLSVFIENSIEDIQFHLIFGGLLAVLIVFIFLRNFRITLISAFAIPISVIATFIFLQALDFTLNNMTMLALSLSIGILIDDAIVVIENIYRHFKSGKSAEEAARFGTAEIGLAAFAITLSIVAVFLPVAFMKGIVGRFFYQFGMTVTFSVLISLFVAFTLTPMLSSRFLKISEEKNSFIARFLKCLDHMYENSLNKVLDYPKTTLSTAVGLLIIAFASAGAIRAEFVPIEDQSEFFIKIKTPLGSTIGATEEVADLVRKKMGHPYWMKYVFTSVGGDSLGKVNEASLYVKMADKNARSITQNGAMTWARELLSDLAPNKISVEPVPRISGGGQKFAALQLDISGTDLNQIEEISQNIVSFMKKQGGYVDVDLSYEKGKPEVEITIKRDEAAALGISPAAIAQTVRPLIGGANINKFRANGNRYNISVRLDESFRNKVEDLYSLSVRSQRGELVPLSRLVDIKAHSGPVQIDRKDRMRIVSLFSNFQEDQKVLGEAMNELATEIERMQLPSGYAIKFAGNAEAMQESFGNLVFALMLAVVVVYMVLASQFESFFQPFIIMLSLPFSMVGAIGILVVTQMTLSIFTVIGIIMLMGLVTKNAILLIDYTNVLREREGLSCREAILKAGPTRLHPILMTTSAMIFGMLPIALSTGPGAESRAPMAMAIIGGLMTSMLLTLLVVPVAYSIADRISNKLSKRAKQPTSLTTAPTV